MEIKRDAYLEQLKIRKDNGMIKIITGIGSWVQIVKVSD